MSSGPIPLTLPSSNATIWMSTHTMQFRLKGRMVMSGEQTMYNNHCASIILAVILRIYIGFIRDVLLYADSPGEREARRRKRVRRPGEVLRPDQDVVGIVGGDGEQRDPRRGQRPRRSAPAPPPGKSPARPSRERPASRPRAAGRSRGRPGWGTPATARRRCGTGSRNRRTNRPAPRPPAGTRSVQNPGAPAPWRSSLHAIGDSLPPVTSNRSAGSAG